MLNAVILDYETRSMCDITSKGTYEYAQDPSTDVICLAGVMYDPEDDREWLWYRGETIPQELMNAISDADYVMAHNALFDRLIHECVGVPDYKFVTIPDEKWFCTSAQARLNAMPASLGDLSRAIDASTKKDFEGARLIRLLSTPQKDGSFCEDPEEVKKMGKYCLDDCRATKASILKLRTPTEQEFQDWHINERINERGIKIDRKLAVAALHYASAEQDEIAAEMNALTDGEITKATQYARIGAYVKRELDGNEDALKMFTVYKGDEKKISTAKDVRTQVLGRADTGEISLPDNVYNVIAALDDGAKSSVAKFRRMIDMADPDTDRVHGAFVCYGAQSTLRYSSRGLQVHNFRRDVLKDNEFIELRHRMISGLPLSLDGLPMPVMDTLSKMLRQALIPEAGNKFVVGDWSGIEARALPWLSGDERAEVVLDLFRKDQDVYVKAARDASIEDPAGDGRQIGKVIVLSLGFGGAAGAFTSMAKNYGVFLPANEVDLIVDRWRRKNAWAVRFWDLLLAAATNAIHNPNDTFEAGRITYKYVPELLNGTLCCHLPGGAMLQYPHARIEITETEFGPRKNITSLKANWKPKADDKRWPRVTLWRGLLAENVTQAFCAYLLRHNLRKFDNVVLHVHDEIVLEVDDSDTEYWAEKLQTEMEHVPDWAEGLPLTAEPSVMDRYGK